MNDKYAQAAKFFDISDEEIYMSLISIVSCILPDNPSDGHRSIGACGEFTKSLKQDWQSYTKDADRFAFVSPGFGYSQESVAEMRKNGFYTGPSVGVFYDMGVPIADNSPYIKDVLDMFARVGIRIFLVRGGFFVDNQNERAVVLDITDPKFLQKLKPRFLERFPIKITRQVLQRFDWDHDVYEEDAQKFFIYNVFKLMRDAMLTEKDGDAQVIDGHGTLILSDMSYSGANKERIGELAAHDVQFSLPALRLMRDVLTPKELNDLIRSAAQLIAGVQSDANSDINLTDHIECGLSG